MTSYTPPTGLARDSLAKDVALRWIDSHSATIIKLSDRIWTLAELSLREWGSAFSVAEVLRKSGFSIDWGAGGFPCAFVATFGSGGPVLGFNAEYDALPGLSQKAGVSSRDPLVYHYDADGPAYGSGHGDAHNALTAGTVAAAIAVAQAITMHGLRATVKVIATSGDEQLVGKPHLVKAGVYDGLDVFLDWRPFDATRALWNSASALSTATFTFRAAAGPDPTGLSPHPGLDGALFLADLAERRTIVGPSGHVQHAINTVPGVAPDLASIRFLLRESSPDRLQGLYRQILSCAREAAAVTGVRLIHHVHTATWNGLANKVGAELVNDNMVRIGAPVFTAEDQVFARGVQRALHRPEIGLPTSVTPLSPPGSSACDLELTTTDVSWQAPTVTALVATFPTGMPRRTWAATAAAGGNIGHQGLLSAARYLAATAVDLVAQPQLLGAMAAEFGLRTAGTSWKSLIPAGSQPPVYEPPIGFLRKTGQAWPPEGISWPVPDVMAEETLTVATGREVLNLR